MKMTVLHRNRNCGSHTTLEEEPYASALSNIDGLACATDNATYRGVRFGRQKQRELTIYLDVDYRSPDWPAIRDTGRGEMDFSPEYLDSILAASAKIDAAISAARPALPTYPCAGHSDGCCQRVTARGSFCRSCDHDENDN